LVSVVEILNWKLLGSLIPINLVADFHDMILRGLKTQHDEKLNTEGVQLKEVRS
jgi:hypothetical protein